MKKAFMYRAVEPARSDGGRATQSTASLLAALCFLLGIAFAAFAPVSPEGRFLVFCFAFAVAIGFYMGGHVLCQAFKLSDKLSGIIEARCAKLLAHFAGERLNRHVKNLQTRLNESELELKHLRSEIEIADKAAANLRSALTEIHSSAHATTQNLEAEKARLQAALDRANGERVRLAYDLANMKRQAGYSIQ
jgi:hypothetical protein